MRDKLIEMLENAHNERIVKCLDCFDDDECLGRGYCDDWLADIADYLIANGVTFAEDNNVPCKWIPVSERPPEYDNFLVATNYGMVGEAFTLDGKIYWQEDAANSVYEIGIYGVPIEEVTHWTPLPAAPKEVE